MSKAEKKSAYRKSQEKSQAHEVHWENRLPSAYETLEVGFHACLTVQEMVKHLGFGNKTKIPPHIRNIKIGSFTPEMFNDPEFKKFWQTPVTGSELSAHDKIRNAANDPDIADVLAHTKYQFDPSNLTLESLARMSQVQYLGYQSRMSEMTSQNMHARIEKLRNPMTYYALRTSDFVKKNNLQDLLPKEPPFFEITKKQFSVKGVKSAMDKAYTRTGKPKDKEKFLAEHEQFGVFGVNDLQRTTIKLNKSGDINPTIVERHYRDVRNVLVVALLTGELGVVIGKPPFGELTDSVLYPPTKRVKDQLPILMAKGDIYHAGPANTYISAPFEIQLPVMPDYTSEETHKLYDAQRVKEKEKENTPPKKRRVHEQLDRMIKSYEDLRLMHFNNSLPDSFVAIREAYMEHGTIVPEDLSISRLMNRREMVGNSMAMKQRAVTIACEEFPETGVGKRVIKLDPFDTHQHSNMPIVHKTLHRMIRH